MPNQSPPPPSMDSTGLPTNTPTTPFNNLNTNLWSVPHALTSPAAGQVQLISPYSTPHPLISSGTPVIITYPAAQPITSASQPSPSVMQSSVSLTPAESTQTAKTTQPTETTQTPEEPKITRRGRKRSSKKGPASSKRKTAASATTSESLAEDKSG
ncbi:uncharacterized protein MELLADRAFT_85453 [Melampsora larici-populina 98AG31]|uniref:Uncharacterized protein n=1 Tax=Melampsora larici-populina (strain 98AG31 / pathotype 3-4-7) TaxID=747676 RepID=F4RIR6_MELLP|nr:uncharacterized protein MELLADRAFT_85453 [Melampsora larici-populina 98AG31]EGG07785.1 hypothetical protein MELLADRAFT_85453 [Melampsora larici-populina 98AG31]